MAARLYEYKRWGSVTAETLVFIMDKFTMWVLRGCCGLGAGGRAELEGAI